jgi:ATP-dependent Lon protease
MFFREKKLGGTSATLPLLPLRELVVFPYAAVSFIVGREKSIAALNEAMKGDKEILLATQREPATRDPGPDEVHAVGTIAVIVQVMRLPDGTVKVLVDGRRRGRITRFVSSESCFLVEVEDVLDEPGDSAEVDALVRGVLKHFEDYSGLGKGVAPEALAALQAIESPGRLADAVVRHLDLKTDDRQQILEIASVAARLERIQRHLVSEIEILNVERKIKTRVKKQIERSQKEYYLNEQMQAIQKELGDKDEFRSEVAEIEARIAEKKLPPEALDRVEREVRKLKMMSPMSAEAAVVRNYVDTILSLPWLEVNEEQVDLAAAKAVLEADHHGLHSVKARILEYLSVVALVGKLDGPILCLVGPPGVGKTSLARSIARATGRQFVRVALGGVRDEAEIRGHRRTYIGALPGKIIQGIKRAGASNPVFLLDEVDKMSTDFRGDPSAALLEVLDPEQNSTFADHYLDLDYDLSKVMFICTANSLQGIPAPLQDRLEIVRLAGYTEAEKLSIARRYLVPRQMKANGVGSKNLRLSKEAVTRVIREYTREAGVRGLERELASVCRKVARRVVSKGPGTRIRVDAATVEKMLGVPRHRPGRQSTRDAVGFVNGLAWTAVGGVMVPIEAARVPGTGKTAMTGQLGNVFRESCQAAITYLRGRTSELGLAPDFWQHIDLHVHVPELWGVDGPSAGITLATAVVSAVCQFPARHDLAMTGEITLRGRVRPIGGLKEKLLAARQAGIRRVVIPRDNEPDLREVSRAVREGLEILPVDTMDEVLELAIVAPAEGLFRAVAAGELTLVPSTREIDRPADGPPDEPADGPGDAPGDLPGDPGVLVLDGPARLG